MINALIFISALMFFRWTVEVLPLFYFFVFLFSTWTVIEKLQRNTSFPEFISCLIYCIWMLSPILNTRSYTHRWFFFIYFSYTWSLSSIFLFHNICFHICLPSWELVHRLARFTVSILSLPTQSQTFDWFDPYKLCNMHTYICRNAPAIFSSFWC